MNKDILVIGGGINGVGIAREAALQGLSVTLCESDDLAGYTSSASTKLIHGGLRYLEQYEFGLVHESLKERRILQNLAPHLIHWQEFLIPHTKIIRPFCLVRLGLFLYDCLDLKNTNYKSHAYLNYKNDFLLSQYKKMLSYYDCTTDDARLVVCIAKDARAHQAEILTRTELVLAERKKEFWTITFKNKLSKKIFTHNYKALINATGIFAEEFAKQKLNISLKHPLSLIQGSHILIKNYPQLTQGLLLQNEDKRVIFVIPYLEKWLLIGTTDLKIEHLPKQKPKITEVERQYLLDTFNHFFKQSISKHQIEWEFSGIRALAGNPNDTPSKISREYLLELNQDNQLAPVLNILGGKLTTFRNLAKKAINALQDTFLEHPFKNTDKSTLQDWNYSGSFEAFQAEIFKQYNFLPIHLLHRLTTAYGTSIHELLKGVNTLSDLGQMISRDLYSKEIYYLQEHEWALSLEDIIWRRTKLGLVLSLSEIGNLKKLLS